MVKEPGSKRPVRKAAMAAGGQNSLRRSVQKSSAC